MTMDLRKLFLPLAGFLALAACAPDVAGTVSDAVSEHAAAPGEGWTMQVIGDDADRVFLVTRPDGKTAAARVRGESCAMVGAEEARTLAAAEIAALAAVPAPKEHVSIEAPGFALRVAGDGDETGTGGRGQVRIDVGGLKVNVDGDEARDGRAAVTIEGVNEDAARRFIDESEELTAEVKAQMLRELGL